MKDSDLLTVIVPVYKVEKYLRRCLDSIVNQTYKNLEIILVDDGPPDNCPAICDEYAKKDSRVKVIHQENKGLSGARNVGLDVATGDYIAFVDSDDWIELDAYERTMYVLIHENLDAIGFNFWYEYSDRSVVGRNTPCNYLNRLMIDDVGSYVWVYVFDKQVFARTGLRFSEGKPYEDFLIISDVFDEIQSFRVLDCCFYHYNRANLGSICNVVNLIDQQYSFFLGYLKRIEFGKKHRNVWIERQCAVKAYRIGVYLYLKNLMVKKFTGNQLLEIKNFLKDFCYSAKWYLLRPQDMLACWCIFHYPKFLCSYAKWKFSRHD